MKHELSHFWPTGPSFCLFLCLFFFFTLQYCIGFAIHQHEFAAAVHVPNPEPPSHLPPHTISLGHPSAPAPSILYPASNLDWRFVSYIIPVSMPFSQIIPPSPSLFIWKLLNMDQFSSVAQSCLTLCDPMNCSTPGLPVHHHLPEFTQTHVHRVGDAIQPSHLLSSPSPPAPNPSQHQSLFQGVNSLHEVAKVLEFQL